MKKFTLILAALAVMSMAAFAEDGAALYKAKCAGCHGAAGEGKMGPALKGTSASEADIAAVLEKGGKKGIHAKGISGLTEDQAKAVATYVKSLK